VKANAVPGTYTIVLRGDSQVSFVRDPMGKGKATVPGSAWAAPVELLVIPTALAKLTVGPLPNGNLKPGGTVEVPVKVERIEDHAMHAEFGRISDATAQQLNAARAEGGRIIAVGTTSLRLLESAAADDGTIQPFAGDTAIFITPGYRFKAVDGLMTNFHLPKSTLMMLVSALIGRERMMAAYAHAIAQEYRFYSYGDSSLLLP